MTDIIGAGHAYRPELGSGVEWLPGGQARLWDGGEIAATGEHGAATPEAFWRDLWHARAFPEVTHWWFGTTWTDAVRVSRVADMIDMSTVTGWMQFHNAETQGVPWLATEGDPYVFSVQMPPGEQTSLPVLLALARHIMGMFDARITPDKWYLATGLVRRDETVAARPDDRMGIDLPTLEEAFPVTRGELFWKDAPTALWVFYDDPNDDADMQRRKVNGIIADGPDRDFRLDVLDAPMREALCLWHGAREAAA